jgi:hypothetical protein
MANPVVIDCAADGWTKIATNVTVGTFQLLDTEANVVYQTYRGTGEAAPTDITDAAPLLGKENVIQHSAAIDVYIWPVGDNVFVRVSL